MRRKAIIFGIKGLRLTKSEKSLFKKTPPWGIILFSRNINNIKQLKNLTNEIKKIFNDKKFPILIDQEGGRVSRLNKIIDLSTFSQEYFGEIYYSNKINFISYYRDHINKISEILNYAGININTVPLLDVKSKKGHKIIGDRSFSSSPYIVKKIGNMCIDFYKNNKIATVIKHIPGHGLAKSDSHYNTPTIKANKKTLNKKAFYPFKNSKSLFGMTAHVIYSNYDKKNTATHSSYIIKKIIRKKINFRGIIISDDISMKSLRYKLEENAIKALTAGCNLVLHCNGKLSEMASLCKIIPNVDKFTQKKTSHFYKFLM